MPSLLHTVRDLGRLREIVGVLARHGFGELLQRSGLHGLMPTRLKPAADTPQGTGIRIRCALEELGPSFVKLGQIASTRPDLIPEDIVVELQQLQDNVPPVPFPQMREQVEQQLGAPIDVLFARLDAAPIASASIGQVYRAQLRTPTETDPDHVDEVVVKVQRPDIGPTMERDIDLLYWLAHAVERSVPEAQLYNPVRMVDEFERTLRAELDYAQEADNADRFRENFTDVPNVRFPRVYRQASARRVLTLEFLPGRNVFAAVKEGASGEHIARTSIQVVIKMVFEHGFFHADPHPGNILIMAPDEAPVLGIIDLGQVGRLSPKSRDRLIDVLIAIGRKDYRGIASALYHLGTPTKRLDRNAFEAEVAALGDRYLGRRLGDIQPTELVRDLIQVSQRFGLEMPAEMMVVVKCLMTIEGIGRQIYPELDLAAELEPFLKDIVTLRYSPERLAEDFLHLATTFAQSAGEFPARAEDILEDIRQGRLSIEARQPQLTRASDRLGKRVAGGLTVSALILSGTYLLAHGQPAVGLGLWAVAALVFGWTALSLFSGRER